MAVCAARHCYNSYKKGFILVRFPTDESLWNQWVSLMQQSGWVPNANNRLCEEHFEADQWIKFRSSLKPNATPTRFCTCGTSTFLKRKKCTQTKIDRHSKPLSWSSKGNSLSDHKYCKSGPIPTHDEAVLDEAVLDDSKPVWSRKIPCPSTCPCRFSHLETCVMSKKVQRPLGTIPLFKGTVFSSSERPSNKLTSCENVALNEKKTSSHSAILKDEAASCA